MDNNARTPIERLRELGEQLWDDGLDTAARIMSECLSQIETELAAANERLSAVEKERNSALDQCTSLHAARAEQIERDAKVCLDLAHEGIAKASKMGLVFKAEAIEIAKIEQSALLAAADVIRAQMDTTHKDNDGRS